MADDLDDIKFIEVKDSDPQPNLGEELKFTIAEHKRVRDAFERHLEAEGQYPGVVPEVLPGQDPPIAGNGGGHTICDIDTCWYSADGTEKVCLKRCIWIPGPAPIPVKPPTTKV